MSERTFPRGRLNSDDEGETQIAVVVDGDVVVIAFPKPTAWVGMPVDQAEELARVISARAVEAKRNRQ